VNGDAGDHLLLAPPATMESVEIKWAAQQVGTAIQEVESEKA
jgi:hypothetical protein